MRDIDAVDMRCGHNVEKGEASTAHRLLRTASGVAPQRPCWQLRCLRTEAPGVRETGEGVQQPSDAAEGCGLGKTTWACLGH